MMKCFSRCTLGVVIGIINVLVYAAIITYAIITLVYVHGVKDRTQEQEDAIDMYNIVFTVLIVLCVIMIIISGLLIIGVVKRHHKLMLPWLILSVIAFTLNIVRYIYTIIAAIIKQVPLSTLTTDLILGILGIAISALILWAIFNLYRDIREVSVDKHGRIIDDDQADYHKPENI